MYGIHARVVYRRSTMTGTQAVTTRMKISSTTTKYFLDDRKAGDQQSRMRTMVQVQAVSGNLYADR